MCPIDQKVLLSVDSVVLSCRREISVREMEFVDELGKVERTVEDRIQTTTIANET